MEEYKLLEKEFAKFVGKEHAVAVNTGTAGLHVTLAALGIKQGDEVIVPDFTMAACGFAVSYTGAKVVTVDCGDDLNINVNLIEEKITANTKAIMGVHIYGRLCDMKKIREIADRYGLYVIEDASEAHGATNGEYADAVVFSLYKNKIIHAEEGGIICTDDKQLAKKINYLKCMAFGEEHDYYHKEIGFNYRMPETQAILARKSLANYTHNNELRRKAEKDLYGKNELDAVWVLPHLCSTQEERDLIVKNDPNTRYFFKPLSTMPMWKQEVGKNALKYSKLGYYQNFDTKRYRIL